MTHDQAVQRAAELNGQDHDGHHWFVREQQPGDYEVVAVNVPGLSSGVELSATILSRPEPTEPPDPRPSLFRAIPPYGAG